MDSNSVKKILSETEAGYDLMAFKFSETRKFFWRDLEFIKDYAQDGDKVLDYGCGNGRLLELLQDKTIEYFGADLSERLVDLARGKYLNTYSNTYFSKINPVQKSLAFPDNFFNTVYSIAVFHHLPGQKLRLETAKELYRVLKPGGNIVITVWNLWQKRYIKNIINNWIDKLTGRSKLDFNDCYISFKNNQGETFQRYHHAFTKRELKKLFTQAGFKTVKNEVLQGRNIIFIGKK
jgi:tRNA (uracil-5-)-methyltransferase TRM9